MGFSPDRGSAWTPPRREVSALVREITDPKTKSPERIKRLISQYDASDEYIYDGDLDKLLGLDFQKTSRAEAAERERLRQQFPQEDLWDPWQATNYPLLRRMLRKLKLKKQDVFYDLGAGCGRVVIYSALTTPAKCVGVEIVGTRVRAASRIQRKLDIPNMEMRAGRVQDETLADGTVFFLFNPFSGKTLKEVIEKLRLLAKTKKIKIVSWGNSTYAFDDAPWLRAIEPRGEGSSLGFKIYESR